MSTNGDIERVTARPRNSAETRASILRKARALFAQAGFARTSVRAIAKAARCDPALIYRYFGTKNELFIEAVSLELELPDVLGLPTDLAIRQLLEHFFRVWEDDPIFIGLLRATASSPEASEVMKAYFSGKIMPKLRQLVPAASISHIVMIGSLVIGLAWARYILENPVLVALSREELIRVAAPALQALVAIDTEPGA